MSNAQPRCGAKSKRGGIPGRVGIENRPAIADQKTEIGDHESDTMIGENHLGVPVTHVDKTWKFLVAGLVRNKTASEINRVTEKLFQEIPPDKRKTGSPGLVIANYSGKRLSEIQTKLCLAWFIARDTVPHTTAHRCSSLNEPNPLNTVESNKAKSFFH